MVGRIIKNLIEKVRGIDKIRSIELSDKPKVGSVIYIKVELGRNELTTTRAISRHRVLGYSRSILTFGGTRGTKITLQALDNRALTPSDFDFQVVKSMLTTEQEYKEYLLSIKFNNW